MTKNLIETCSTQSYDEYLSTNNYYELDGIIDFSSPTLYDENPQEIENYEIKTREDYSIFDENLQVWDYEYISHDHSIPMFDEYSQESEDDDYMIENDSLPTF